MTDGNIAALESHLAQFEGSECPYCDVTFEGLPECDCAEEAAHERGDHEYEQMREG